MANPLSPPPWDVRSARHRTGLTMQEAGELVYESREWWLRRERDHGHPDYIWMHPAFAELFALKTGLKELIVLPLELKDT